MKLIEDHGKRPAPSAWGNDVTTWNSTWEVEESDVGKEWDAHGGRRPHKHKFKPSDVGRKIGLYLDDPKQWTAGSTLNHSLFNRSWDSHGFWSFTSPG